MHGESRLHVCTLYDAAGSPNGAVALPTSHHKPNTTHSSFVPQDSVSQSVSICTLSVLCTLFALLTPALR